MVQRFNKGEWSEFYAFLKLLIDGNLCEVDNNLTPIKENQYYQIISAINNNIEFNRKNTDVEFKFQNNVISIPIKKIKEISEKTVNTIVNSKTNTFEISETSDFAKKQLHIDSIKEKSSSKGDIILKIHPLINPELKFSIKSYLGSKPTLLNASKGTIINYNIDSLNNNEINSINSINDRNKIQHRIQEIKNNNAQITFDHLESKIFDQNLKMIDTNFPNLIGELYLDSYFVRGKKISEVVNYYLQQHQNEDEKIIKYKIKEFLIAIALGMMPEKEWSGLEDADGGYIVIKQDANIVHIHDRNNLKDYLYENTKFDTPSTSRTNAGKIIKNGNSLIFKLTMHIRFI